MSAETLVFSCKMCGQCCEGKGGIVLSLADQQRLCDALKIDRQALLNGYTHVRNGKVHLRAGADGRCLFFQAGEGCIVHDRKPDVCRAWPFFRGNMVDEASLFLAKAYCPGIRPRVTHADFVAAGLRYLEGSNLVVGDDGDPAREGAGTALLTRRQLESLTRAGKNRDKA